VTRSDETELRTTSHNAGYVAARTTSHLQARCDTTGPRDAMY